MIELADLMLSLCQLLKRAKWSDPGDAYELGVIAQSIEHFITEQESAQ